MPLLSKSNLVYSDYSWTVYGDDDPKVTGTPDDTLLNRKEGYEILYFINVMAKIKNLKSISSGQKMERMIHDNVPSNIRSQKNVREWIDDEWDNY